MTSLGVIGLGYVGLPLAVGFTSRGHSVVGCDVIASTVDLLRSGRSYRDDVAEDGCEITWIPGLVFQPTHHS